MFQDLRFGFRILLKRPGFALLAALTLALGVGANTAIFSVVLAVLIRPLPYHNADQVVWLSNRNSTLGVSGAFLNPADILDFQEQSKTFEQIAAWGTLPINLYGARTPERVESVYATPNFFRTLGVRPALGRDFADSDQSDAAVIISHGLWQRQFGGDPNIIGRKLEFGVPLKPLIDGHTIVGVLPPETNFPARVDLFTSEPLERTGTDRGGPHNWRTIGRLKPGITVAQAQSELDLLTQRQAELYPETNKGWDVQVQPLREYLFGSSQTALPLLFCAVGLVLLIACANVANLQLSRAFARRKEFALRIAVGAKRSRIVRQVIVESLLLSLLGGGLGVLFASGCLSILRTLGPESIPRLMTASLNAPVLIFAIAISILSGVVFGLVPALQASHSSINQLLKGSDNAGASGRRSNRFRRSLVIGQIALALVLLTGAGLVIKSFRRLQEVDPGFKTDHLLTAGVSLSFNDYPNGSPKRTQFFVAALERLSSLPGVTSAGAISHLPFGGRTMKLPFFIKGHSTTSVKNEDTADYRVVTPSFFRTAGVELIKGRLLDEHDRESTSKVFVVNQAFVRSFLPGIDPIGAQLEGESAFVKGEIVGVVANVKHKGLELKAEPAFYVSYQQSATFPIMNFLIHTESDPEQLAGAVQRELQALDPKAVVFNVRPFSDFIADSVAPRRFNLWLFSAFGSLALLLATAGIYGTINYAVTQRTREIGIRIALGAQRRDILTLVLSDGMRLIVIGSLFGLIGSLAVTRWMQTLLFSVSPTDPITYVVVGALLIVVALIASWIPARRATRVDPVISLRYE